MNAFPSVRSYRAVVFALLLPLAGCESAPSPPPSPSPQPATAIRNPLAIAAETSLLEQLTIGEPEWTDVSEDLTVPARVEVDNTRMARIGAPLTGRVTEVLVYEGQTVERGQVLARLYSADLAEVQLVFLKAHSQRRLAEQAASRAQQLFKAAVIGSADLQRREAELIQSTAELLAARRQLEVLGVADSTLSELEHTHIVNATTQIMASMNGTVLERKISIGQVVQPAETVLVIADLSQVWLIADVPEQSSGTVQRGHSAQAQVPALPGVLISGALSFVSPTVNADTRTVRMRMDLPNPEGKFKPAMLATMTLQSRAARQQVIPLSAVVREGEKEHVFVQQTPDSFVLRAVAVGQQFHNRRVLLGGVQPGEKIVLDGAFHLNNERKRQAVRAS